MKYFILFSDMIIYKSQKKQLDRRTTEILKITRLTAILMASVHGPVLNSKTACLKLQYNLQIFCMKLRSAFVEKAFLYVKVMELRFWYLLLIADIFRTSKGCKCNESILFFRCTFFVGLGDLVNLTTRAGWDFTENCGLLPYNPNKADTYLQIIQEYLD